MSGHNSCPICLENNAVVVAHPTRDASKISCHQCGDMTVSRTAIVNLQNLATNQRWKLSAWINEFGSDLISYADVETALESSTPTLHHRADRMLRWIVNAFPPGERFSFDELGKWEAWKNKPGDSVLFVGGNLVASRLTPVGWNRNLSEVEFMVAEVLCNEMKLLVSEDNREYQVSPKGLLYLEGRRETASSIGFCAMWFNKEVAPLWINVIEPAIRMAGYEPLRIDAKQHNGKIDDEIMASIRSSRFVVSDFTGNRGGVYYEAGFAHGLGLPVIFMCRDGDELHFDIRQYNCIFWDADNIDAARTKLTNRIVATLGKGPILLPDRDQSELNTSSQ